MSNKLINFIKNCSITLISNSFSMIVSVLVTLILPKFLDISQYSNYQLYVFYSTYTVFLDFGMCCGIYLKYGGCKYDDLNDELLGNEFWILNLYLMITFILLSILIMILTIDFDNKMIILISLLSGMFTISRYFILFLLQCINYIKEYAKIIVIDRLLFLIGIIFLLIMKIDNYMFLLFVDIITKIISLIMSYISLEDKLPFIFKFDKFVLQDIIHNTKIGIKLLCANITGQLLIGIIRFSIKNVWSVNTFGKVSLSLSVCNILITFVGAISIVMYPTLRNVEKDDLIFYYQIFKEIILVICGIAMIFYYPLILILTLWLPQYAESLSYMSILFPIAIFSLKNDVIINTYQKILRQESLILKSNIISVLISIALAFLFGVYFKNLYLLIMSILFVVFLRSMISELYLNLELSIFNISQNIKEIYISLLFIVTQSYISGFLGFLIYLVGYIAFFISEFSTIKSILLQFKEGRL